MRAHINRYKGNYKADCNLATMPLNGQISGGTLYEDFESTAGWSVANGSIAANVSQFKTGSQSIKMTCNASLDAQMTKTVNWDLSGNWQHMLIWFYVHGALTDYQAEYFYIKLANDAGLSNYMLGHISNANKAAVGWNTYSLSKNDFTSGGSGTFASAIIRERPELVGNATGAAISYDSLYFGVTSLPGVMIWFDDGYASQYAAFQYMKPKGIRASLSWESDTTNITLQQLLEMDRAGWTIANHTDSSTVLTTLTEAQQETAISNCRTWLNTRGLTRGSNYLVYPGGGNDANTITAMTNLGILTGRNAKDAFGNGGQNQALPFSSIWQLPANSVTTAWTLATVEGYIDEAIAGGYIMPLLFHNLGGGGGQWIVSDFNALMDYIYAKYKDGLIFPYTIDDFYNNSISSRKIPKANR